MDTKEEQSLWRRRIEQLVSYQEWASLAKEQTGKSLLTQIREICSLKQLGGQCGVTDYYWFKLYDASYQRGRGAKDFLGWRLEPVFNPTLNPRHAVLPAWDKIVFNQLADAAGLPVPPVKACFHRAGRIPDVLGRHIKTLEEAKRFLRNSGNYPVFSKPAFSQQGFGSEYLAGYEPTTDSVQLLDGKSILVEEFIRRLVESVDCRYHRPECGFLFQEPLRLAPEIEELTNWPSICGVRVVCLNGLDGVKPIGVAWKIAIPPNSVDNFHMGAYGNLVAEVDLLTGEVGRVIDGFWPATKILDVHPRSGKSFKGFKLPGWSRLLEICKEAGSVFPLMKIQHWDFALTDKGPIILELNDMGGTQIVQLFGQGLLTEETRVFIRTHVDGRKHPWVRSL